MRTRVSLAVCSAMMLLATHRAADAQSRSFYFHTADPPVAVPGGTSATFLDEVVPAGATVQVVQTPTIAGGASGALPRFVGVPNAGDGPLLGPLVFARLQLSANSLMRRNGLGCADITVTLEHVDAGGVATPIGTGTLRNAEIPQGGQGGATGFAEFVVEIEGVTDRTLDAGEALAATVAITNQCTANRRVNFAFDAVGAPARIEFLTLDPLASACIDNADKSLTRYVKSRLVALAKCRNDVNGGTLPAGTDCHVEDKTAARLARALLKLERGLAKKCAGTTLFDPPPAGLNVGRCPGLRGTCAFDVAVLDDGMRGDANDYVDCLACLGDQASDTLHGVAFRSTTAAPLGEETTAPCQEDVGKAGATFEVKALKLLQRCRKGVFKGKLAGACPDAKTTTKLDRATERIGVTLAKHCTDALVTAADPDGLGLVACPGPPASCAGPVAGVADEVACIACTHDFFARCLFPATLGKSRAGCE